MENKTGTEVIYDGNGVYSQNSELYQNFLREYPAFNNDNFNVKVTYNYDNGRYELSVHGYRVGDTYIDLENITVSLPENNDFEKINVKFTGASGVSKDDRALLDATRGTECDSNQAFILGSMSSKASDNARIIEEAIKMTTNDNSTGFIDAGNNSGFIERTNVSTDVGCFSGGLVNATNYFIDTVIEKPNEKHTLFLVDPAKQFGTYGSSNLNEVPYIKENGYSVFTGQDVVAVMHANSFSSSGVYSGNPNEDGGSNWRGRTDFQQIAMNCNDFIVFEAQGNLANKHTEINSDIGSETAKYGFNINENWDFSNYKAYRAKIVADENGNPTCIWEQIEIDDAVKQQFIEVQESNQDNGDEKITVDYNFIIEYMQTISKSIDNCYFRNMENVTNENPSSLTFAAVTNIFNNYKLNSNLFFNNINITCGNILKIADSYKTLDDNLAQAIYGELNAFDLAPFIAEFSKQVDLSEYSLLCKDGDINLSRNELLNALSDQNKIISALSQDIVDSLNTKNSISSFINDSSNVLLGDTWNLIRTEMSEYVFVLDTKIDYANNLILGFKESFNILLEALGDYDELDYSKKGEYEIALSELETLRDNLVTTRDSIPPVEYNYYIDEKGNLSVEVIDNSAIIAEYNALIEECDKVIQEMTNVLEHINNLPIKDSEAANKVDETAEEESIPTEEENDINLVPPTVDPDAIDEANELDNDDNSTSSTVNDGKENTGKSSENKVDSIDDSDTSNDKDSTDETQKEEIPNISTGSNSHTMGLYTKEQIESMTEEQVKSMSSEEFINFIGSAAVQVYNEQGGVLPSVTIAQALLESGYGNNFNGSTYNVYGLKGYPYDVPTVGGLKQFDNFYEATKAHADYFEHFSEDYNFAQKVLELSDSNNPLEATNYLWGYADGSKTYGPEVLSLILENDLTKFDEIAKNMSNNQ